MNEQDNFLLHSAKRTVRRLRMNADRLDRNHLLSSVNVIDSTDVDMSEDMTVEYPTANFQVNQPQTTKVHRHEFSNRSAILNRSDDVPLRNAVLDENIGENENSSPMQQSDDETRNTSLPTVMQISVVLALFRHRHNLSKSCINDLCNLLKSLGVENVPADFRSIEKAIIDENVDRLGVKTAIFCSSCGEKSKNPSKCENVQCSSNAKFQLTPATVCTFKILPQLTCVLERHSIINEMNYRGCPSMRDVQQGEFYRRVVHQHYQRHPESRLITLLLNSDGVLLKKFNRSIWITCMVINELPRSVRFNIENVIICSISIGSTKPKKTQFQRHIEGWVSELQQLEMGFYTTSLESNDMFIRNHAYLIAAALDKPAQSLLMNLSDPTGFFSCPNCTIKGKSVQSGHGTIRVFIKNQEKNVENRSNILYDTHITHLSQRKIKLKTNDQRDACGQHGPCLLRGLSFFQIGQSFTTDSLHNIYSGVFKRLLEMWFVVRREPFSIHEKLHSIENQLEMIKYPSTTYHVPSPLKHFQTFKGNEFRIVLLFGYQYFKNYLLSKYYNHLQMLAIAVSLAESNCIDQEKIEMIDVLLNEFDCLFPSLYLEKNVTSVVHSVTHVSRSVKDFGPLQNYSTFNFESVIGSIVRTVNGPNLIVSELANNIMMFKCATARFENETFTTNLKLFTQRIFSSKRKALPDHRQSFDNIHTRFGEKLVLSGNDVVLRHLNEQNFTYSSIHKTFWKRNVRFSVYNSVSTARYCDACVLLRLDSGTACGFILAITSSVNQQCHLIIRMIDIDHQDCVRINGRTIVNPYIYWGRFTDPPQMKIVDVDSVIMKLAYKEENNAFHFFQFPNTVEST